MTQGPNPYIQSVPSSSSYALSLADGVVMVATPTSATPVDANSAGACSGAGQGGTTPGSTTPPPSNGVTAVAACSTSRAKGSDALTVLNTSEMTSLTITIDVTSAASETLGSPTEKFTYRSAVFTDSEASSGDELQYSYSLKTTKPPAAPDVIAANSQGTDGHLYLHEHFRALERGRHLVSRQRVKRCRSDTERHFLMRQGERTLRTESRL